MTCSYATAPAQYLQLWLERLLTADQRPPTGTFRLAGVMIGPWQASLHDVSVQSLPRFPLPGLGDRARGLALSQAVEQLSCVTTDLGKIDRLAKPRHLGWMHTHSGPSDLSDEERAILAPLVAPAKQAGHPQALELCRIVDGMTRHVLPSAHRLPVASAAARVPALDGRVLPRRAVAPPRHLGAGQHRLARAPSWPTAVVINIQSVRTTEAGGPRGYDGGKKASGRKWHSLVDTEGKLLNACVHRAMQGFG